VRSRVGDGSALAQYRNPTSVEVEASTETKDAPTESS